MKKISRIFIILLILNFQKKIFAQVYNVVGCSANQPTLSLGVFDTLLAYSSGSDTMCDISINSLGIWDNKVWKTYGSGLPKNFGGRINDFTNYNNELILGGSFYLMDSVLVNKIARWNGTEWRALGTGLNAQLNIEKINCLAVYKGELYAAGKFNEINGLKNVNNIARWDGSTWRSVGTGIQGSLPIVYTMEVYNNELYVGGSFLNAGGISAYNIARWNGQTWNSVGLGTSSDVNKLLKDSLRNILYVSGDFDAVDNSILSRKIASWNGQNWSSMTESKFFGSTVVAMEMYHGYLYAGGYKFSDTCFARWDGNRWEVINGFNSNITQLKTYKNELYIGGTFTMIGTDSIPYLARYYTQDSVTVGLNKTKNPIQFTIFPNPTNNNICIKNNKSSSDEFKIIITNSNGVKVKELVITNKEYLEIEMLNVNPGMYFISIFSNEFGVYSQKINIVE